MITKFKIKNSIYLFSMLSALLLIVSACSGGGGGGSNDPDVEKKKQAEEQYVNQQVAQDVLYAAYAGSGSGVDFNQHGEITMSALDSITTGDFKVLLYEVLNPLGIVDIFYNSNCEVKNVYDINELMKCVNLGNIIAFTDLLTKGSATFTYDLKKNKTSVGTVRFSIKPTTEWNQDPEHPSETNFELNIGFNKDPGYVSSDITSSKFKFTGSGIDDLSIKLKGYTSCYFAEEVNGKIVPIPINDIQDIFGSLQQAFIKMVQDAFYGTDTFKYKIIFSFYISSGEINARKTLQLAYGANFENIVKYKDWKITYSNTNNEGKMMNYYELPQLSIFDMPQYINKSYSLQGGFSLNDASYYYDVIYGQLDGSYEAYDDPGKYYIGFEGDIVVPKANNEKVHVYSMNYKVFTDIFEGNMKIDDVPFSKMNTSIDNMWKSGMLSMKDSAGKVSNVYLNSDGSVKFNNGAAISDWKKAFSLAK